MELRDWIITNLSKPDYFHKYPLNWDILFGVVPWNLWLHRNQVVFASLVMDWGSILDRSKRIQLNTVRALRLISDFPPRILICNMARKVGMLF
ncbi:hypothetical protein V6N12_017916 [Hibiscus sabdariffa]|uniref:Uncharacterized protein n=1 Tax=Hibiscus sabdariffa TaxID=183260 RepID=A0ABR2BKU0_9ROSI